MASLKSDKNRCELILPSLVENVEKAEEVTELFSRRGSFPESERDSIAIAVTEAVNNAILHGNRQDPAKMVYFTVQLEKDAIRFIVKDEGRGFNPDDVPNPLDPENLLKESGRGIFILKSLMDEVTYDFSKGGTEITMVKYKKHS